MTDLLGFPVVEDVPAKHVARVTFGAWLDARWKAVVALVAPVLIGYLGIVLIDPQTTSQVQSVLPDQLKWAVPPIIGILTALVVHTTPNVKADAD